MTLPKPVRRVVTGHNAAGKSIFVMDATSPHLFGRRTDGSGSHIW